MSRVGPEAGGRATSAKPVLFKRQEGAWANKRQNDRRQNSATLSLISPLFGGRSPVTTDTVISHVLYVTRNV